MHTFVAHFSTVVLLLPIHRGAGGMLNELPCFYFINFSCEVHISYVCTYNGNNCNNKMYVGRIYYYSLQVNTFIYLQLYVNWILFGRFGFFFVYRTLQLKFSCNKRFIFNIIHRILSFVPTYTYLFYQPHLTLDIMGIYIIHINIL